MTTIIVEELDCRVTRAPACEYFASEIAEDGEQVLILDLTPETVLILRQDDAEDLYNSLAMHFAGL